MDVYVYEIDDVDLDKKLVSDDAVNTDRSKSVVGTKMHN
jgi:hypothetical protein